MIKKFSVLTFTNKSLALILVSQIFIACVPGSNGLRGKSGSASTGNTNVAVSQGRVLKDNPIILSGNANLSATADLSKYLSTDLITSNSFLQGNANCSGLTYCFEVQEKLESASALQTTDGKWAFKVTSEQFLQVNAFYHTNKIFDQYFANMGLTFSGSYGLGTVPAYDTAIPLSLRNIDGTYNLNKSPLTVTTNCDEKDNAYYKYTPVEFNPATETICYGYSGTTKQIRWAQDSTVIYHETGHFFQRLQLNFRNIASVVKVQMGQSLYSEATALGEGLADFFSYYVNGRTHWGEWAAGKVDGSRPLSEADAQHAPGISLEEDQRLSYPQYLTYDSNYPTEPVEDVHMSGMIISHYLVALTSDIETTCLMTNKDAREYVMYILNESLAELGDLTSVGTYSGAAGKVNLNSTYSFDWYTINNPINYRSLTQTIAKNLLITIGNAGLARCNGGAYSKDRIETVLDNYGLLLFRKYNQHRNLTSGVKINTSVNASNRKKSVLIAKSNLILDPTTGSSSAYVIDNREKIYDGVQKFVDAGALSNQTDPTLSYNNNNSKVSPGEVVAIALNLYNNSNSTMGGVEVLGNDWDHAETKLGATVNKPCKFSSTLSTDGWPLTAEGAASVASDAASTCDTIATTSSDFAPVCFIQSTEASATKWISQKAFKEKIALDSNACLDPTNDKNCFIRTVKGFEKSYYAKINPKSTWGQTMANPTTGEAYSLDWGNIMLFEVSKSIPPGTVVSCRLRARFTNCEDCYHDSLRDNNDYLDKEYNGPRPYKIIQLQIPITD
jgi:hypothetical protein